MNKTSVFGIACGIIFSFFFVETGFSQCSPESKIRLYNHVMNPRQHPDDRRRPVQPPDAAILGNRVQFISLRWFDDNFKSTIDKYTVEYNLGNILWPVYSFLYRDDFKDIIAEIKQRNLFLFDIWGYVPGSGPGTAGQKNELGSVYTDPYFWQQFIVPPSTFGYLEKELGPRWLGMDNGEQDGRYVGGFADQISVIGSNREKQYLNFQNHFQGLGDRLGNKLATLVSLNFGHYFLKEGIYTLIGAETAQALPNSQVYYSFIRGAGKQYGVPWFGNASVWNRWGAKNYEGFTSMDGTMGKTKGTSLSLLKRLMVNHIMYNCVAVGFESGFLDEKGNLSPIGEIQQSMNQWVQKNGNPGILYTPVAILCDFFAGWTFPRHLYTSHVFRVWGNLPYQEGDYLTDGLLALLYPEYRDASYFHDETGFVSSTPYGDIADCILSDAPVWLLKQYPVLVVGGELTGGHEIKDKLGEYVRAGGHLVITAGSLENLPDGLLGVQTGQKEYALGQETVVALGDDTFTEESRFTIKEIVSNGEATILASCPKGPLAVEYAAGSGKMTVFASAFGTGSDPGPFVKSQIDIRFDSPYPLLKHVRRVMDQIFSATEIFTAGEGLSVITCSKNRNEYTVAISNNTWKQKPFALTSNSGKIVSVEELPLERGERKAVGFVPEGVTGNLGKNSKETIAGGDVRVFSVRLETDVIEEKPEVLPVPNPEKRGLTLRNIVSVKEEILLRPTFFQHFDRVVIDWKYLAQREDSVLQKESEWINRQGLKLIVDFSSGINLFPDLRLIDNHPEYADNRKTISSVMRKMKVMGADDMVLPLHRMVENNISWDQYLELLHASLRDLCREAAENDIDVHIKSVQGGSLRFIEQLSKLVKTVNEPNLYFAPSTAMLLYHEAEYEKALKSLKNEKIRFCFVSAPELDHYKEIWNANCPVHRYPDLHKVKVLLKALSKQVLILDGIYPDKDEEYLDVKVILSGQQTGRPTVVNKGVSQAAQTASLKAGKLTCEYLENPLGIDIARPRFSWTLVSDERNQKQSAYELIVSDNREDLERLNGNVWKTGKMATSQSLHLVYNGLPLKSFQRYYWRVKVYDQDDLPSPWSNPAWFETAMRSDSDWQAKWISDGSSQFAGDEDFYGDDPMPLFRKLFLADKKVVSARLYISGLGYYEAFLNGRKIGDRLLDPGWTDYQKQVPYSVYDISDQLCQGTNAIGIMPGNGWYNVLPLRMWGHLNLRDALETGRPCVKAQIRISYSDGSVSTIATDETWQTLPGPVLRNSVYLGEHYDARLEQEGWAMPAHPEGMKNAVVTQGPPGILTPQMQPPVRITKILKPVRITEPEPGVFLVDMGQNFAGVVRIKVKGKRGSTVVLRYGEDICPDGKINVMTSVAGQIKNRNGGPGAPPVAWQEDRYTLKGNGLEIWAPRFTFQGFRYVEVTGWPGKLTAGDIEGLRMNSDVQETGSFTCSNDLLNRLHEVARWTFLSNLFSVQSDCPAREKFGYGGDIVATAEAFLYQFDMANFYRKTIRDFAESRRPLGGMTETAPYVGIADSGPGDGSGPLGWQLAFPYLMKQLYDFYGDRKVIEDHYQTLVRQVEFLQSKAEENLYDRGLSDHESLDPRPVALTSSAFYYHHVRLLAGFAAILEKQTDFQRYTQRADTIKEAILKKFQVPGTGRFDRGTQTAQIVALWYDFVPEDKKKKALEVLLEAIDCRQGHLSTGIFGTKMIFDVLRENDRSDIAYDIVNRRDFPGWGYMLENGATTLWETWAYSDNIYSHNHPMFGSVSEWFYRSLLGLHAGEPGFGKIIVKPQSVAGLAFATGSYHSIRGPITCHWENGNQLFRLEVGIPANTTAEIWIPAKDAEWVTEGEKPIQQVKEIKYLRSEDGYVILETGSGTYSFEVGHQK